MGGHAELAPRRGKERIGCGTWVLLAIRVSDDEDGKGSQDVKEGGFIGELLQVARVIWTIKVVLIR